MGSRLTYRTGLPWFAIISLAFEPGVHKTATGARLIQGTGRGLLSYPCPCMRPDSLMCMGPQSIYEWLSLLDQMQPMLPGWCVISSVVGVGNEHMYVSGAL